MVIMVHSDMLNPLDTSELPHSRSTRPRYSVAQLQAYFSLIALPPLFYPPILAEPLTMDYTFCPPLCGIVWPLSPTKT